MCSSVFFLNFAPFLAYLELREPILKMDFNLDEIIDEGHVEGKISFITSIDNPSAGNLEQEISPEKVISVLPLRGIMLFPETMVPVSIGRDSSFKLLKEAQKKNSPIAVFSQVDDAADEPDYEQLYHTGVIGKVQKIIKLPDGSKTALIQGYTRARLIDMEWNGNYNVGHVEIYPEDVPERGNREYMAIVDTCRETAIKLMRTNEQTVGSAFALNNITDKTLIINFICSNLNISNKERIVLLEENNYEVGNIDSIIIAQRPKMMPHLTQMRQNVADALGIGIDRVSIKATTEEGLGFTGRGEGIAAQATCLLNSLMDEIADSRMGVQPSGCAMCPGRNAL